MAHELPNASTVDEEIYLVCTNGQRDLCCARFGLPLFEALAFEFGQRIWQTTHIGGHRYAPNLVALPSGMVYGYVDPEDGVSLVNEHDAGLIRAANLRGRSAYPPAGQASEAFVRLAQNLSHIDDYRHLEVTSHPSESGTQHNVAFTGKVDGQICLKESLSAPELASCGAQPKPTKQFSID